MSDIATIFITPDGIRWEDCGYYVIAVEDDTCETIGEFWPLNDIGGWYEQEYRLTYMHCGETWVDVWTSACDSECPKCGKPITPAEIEDIE